MAHAKQTSAMRDIRKACQLRKQFGIKSAAGYLRNNGYSVEFALYVLTRRS